MKRWPFGFVILFMLLAACSNDPMFETGDAGAQGVTISTLKDGALAAPGSTIPVGLAFTEEFKKKKSLDSLSLEAALVSESNVTAATALFGPEKIAAGALSPVALPQLQPGVYRMVFTLKDGLDTLVEKETTFFYDPGQYAIAKISAYPPSFLPGSTGIFRAFFSVPPGADPFVRWTLDDKVVQESVVSKGGDRFSWNTPSMEGVYSVKVELFPFPPPGGGTFPFPAGIFIAGQVYVDKTKRLAETDFAPESEYYALFHFLGNLKDDGYRGDKREHANGNLQAVGSPRTDFSGDVFGYLLDGETGFKAGEILLPAPDGLLSPFTLRMRLFPREPSAGRILFRTASDDGLFEFSVFTDPEGLPSFRLMRDGGTVVKNSGAPLPAGRTILLELSLKNSEEILESSWSFDGRIVSTSVDAFAIESVPPLGYSFIGGQGGFAGLLDEFGIRPDAETPPPEMPDAAE